MSNFGPPAAAHPWHVRAWADWPGTGELAAGVYCPKQGYPQLQSGAVGHPTYKMVLNRN